MKIVEYVIVDSTSTTNLNKFVNENINKGYQPLGSLVFNFNACVYSQTMVKYEA